MKTQNKTEFDLSDRIRSDGCILDIDVKEFIRRLKEEVGNTKALQLDFDKIIDKLAGEKLK